MDKVTIVCPYTPFPEFSTPALLVSRFSVSRFQSHREEIANITQLMNLDRRGMAGVRAPAASRYTSLMEPLMRYTTDVTLPQCDATCIGDNLRIRRQATIALFAGVDNSISTLGIDVSVGNVVKTDTDIRTLQTRLGTLRPLCRQLRSPTNVEVVIIISTIISTCNKTIY